MLYLTKHSRLNIANAVCELSKSMDRASKLQFREMLQVIKFILDTKDLGLKIVLTLHNGIWKLEAFSDSDFAKDITGSCLSQKSFWSCTHVNSCQNYTLYINLHILLIFYASQL